MTRAEIRRLLLGNTDPYAGFPDRPYDGQGWGSWHPFLADTVGRDKPSVIVEVGVWKGASALELALAATASGPTEITIIAVDTWLGSWDQWIRDDLRAELPGLYQTFLSNVAIAHMTDIIVPLRLDSQNARHVLKQFGIIPDLVHIDGAHDYQSLAADLAVWWDMLAPGGTVIVDDYMGGDGQPWPDVKFVVDMFREQAVTTTGWEHQTTKCRFSKPRAGAAT